MATRWHCPPDSSRLRRSAILGVRGPTLVEHAQHALRRARAASMPGRSARSGSATISRDAHASDRDSRTDPGTRSACRSRSARSSSPARSWTARPSHTISPPRRRPEPQQRARQRRLAAAGFADDAQRLAGARRRTRRHRPRRSSRARRNQPSRNAVAHAEVAHRQRLRRAAAGGARALPAPGVSRRGVAASKRARVFVRAAPQDVAHRRRAPRLRPARMTSTSSASAAITPMSCVTTRQRHAALAP